MSHFHIENNKNDWNCKNLRISKMSHWKFLPSSSYNLNSKQKGNNNNNNKYWTAFISISLFELFHFMCFWLIILLLHPWHLNFKIKCISIWNLVGCMQRTFDPFLFFHILLYFFQVYYCIFFGIIIYFEFVIL